MYLPTSRLYVFVDALFAQNRDLSSQIGYIIVWANEVPTCNGDEVAIRGNILHWSSVKCKRVTRSVPALERLVDTNELRMKVVGWVDRPGRQ